MFSNKDPSFGEPEASAVWPKPKKYSALDRVVRRSGGKRCRRKNRRFHRLPNFCDLHDFRKSLVPRRLGSAMPRSVSSRHTSGSGFRPNPCKATHWSSNFPKRRTGTVGKAGQETRQAPLCFRSENVCLWLLAFLRASPPSELSYGGPRGRNCMIRDMLFLSPAANRVKRGPDVVKVGPILVKIRRWRTTCAAAAQGATL